MNGSDPVRDMKKITLRLDPSRVLRWHLRLAERLARRPDTQIAVEWVPPAAPLPRAGRLLMAFERAARGVAGEDATAGASVQEFAKFRAGNGAADHVIDFTETQPGGGSAWRVAFDGRFGENAVLTALIQGRTPIVSVTDAAGALLASGRPGTDHPDVLVRGFNDVLARTTTLIIAALDGAAPTIDAALQRGSPLSSCALVAFGAKSLARAALRRGYRTFYNTPHWRVGWRFVDGSDVVDLHAHPPGGWRELSDSGTRFYADPFPIVQDGRTFVFFEDFAHAAGYGVISVVEFDASGPLGAPQPVLDTGSHLSYPFVFAHDGAIWMVPESSAAGTIDLYRATAFPDGWRKEMTLVSDIDASDATPFEHAGRWWMLATVRDACGTRSDTLHAWSAARLTGPWRPHAKNPLLIDIATARPAGRVVQRDGKLIRPFQDCRAGYGAALGIAEITRLDDGGFLQRVETILRPGPLWTGRRLHTLNRAGRLECIDGSASARRF